MSSHHAGTAPAVPRWAYLFEHDGAGPDDRWRLEGAASVATVVAVPDVDAAVVAARGLVDGGVTLVELCGGFGVDAVSRVRAALPEHVAVGHVTFGADSILPAAAYARAAEASAVAART